MSEISTRIKQLMQHLNLRQADVAEALGISIDRVKSLTSGRVHQLKMKEVHAMVEKFHLNPLWLTSGEGPMLETDVPPPGETSAFGERIRHIRTDLGWSQDEMADKTGVSCRTIGNYERGGRIPDADFLARLASHGVDVLYLLTGEKAPSGSLSVREAAPAYRISTPDVEYVYVPRYDVQASAGSGAVVNDESIVDSLAFKRDWIVRALGLDPARLALINVAGDSMTPTISDGDLILLDTRPMTHRAEGIYVISHDNALLVKRLRVRLNGDVEIISDNPRYGSETITGEQLTRLRIVGRVVWQGRRV